MKAINVRGLVKQHLKANGYGGLYCRQESCGCTIEDGLFPCGNDLDAVGEDCVGGYVKLCRDCPRLVEGNCPVPDADPDEGGWCVGPKDTYPEPRRDD